MSSVDRVRPRIPHTEPVAFDRIAKRIGVKLRDIYAHPEAEALPTEHVDLLLRLRHKERDRARLESA